MRNFLYIIISNEQIYRVNPNAINENQYILKLTHAPNSKELKEFLKENYNLSLIRKEKAEPFWIVNVKSISNMLCNECISYNKFLDIIHGKNGMDNLYKYIYKQQNRSPVKLQYGIRDNKIINIWDLTEDERGLNCRCLCPGCGMELQAKLGSGKIQRHFSHNNSNCNIAAAQQTALHILAKEIIEKYQTIAFPAVTINLKDTDTYREKNIFMPNNYELDDDELEELYDDYLYDVPRKLEYKKSTTVKFDAVDLEKRVSSIVPDIIAHIGTRECLIEIAVTHFIDDNKLQKIHELKYPVLEIDVSSLIGKNFTKKELVNAIIKNTKNKKWVYNPLWVSGKKWANQEYKKIISKIERDYLFEKKQREKFYENERNKRLEKSRKKESGIIKLQTVLSSPKKYSSIISNLRDDNQFEKFYKNSSLYSKSPMLPFYLDIPICGEFIFNCDRRIWQTLLFQKFIYNRSSSDISIKRIISWIKNHQDVFTINWEYSYKTRFNDKYLLLINDVIEDYLFYLEYLGFCEYHDTPSGGIGCVFATKTITPPNVEASNKLQIALNSTNGNTPDINEKILICLNNLNHSTI